MKRLISFAILIVMILQLVTGAAYAEMMYCRFCGKQISADSVFCQYCGKKLASETEEDITATQVEKDETVCTWKYFTYRLPEGFETDNLNRDQLQLSSGDRSLMIQRTSLESNGLSEDLAGLGDKYVLLLYLSSISESFDIELIRTGTKGCASYALCTYEASGIKIYWLVILHEDAILVFAYTDIGDDTDTDVLEWMLEELEVSDEAAAGEKNELDWDILPSTTGTRLRFNAFDREILVTFPDGFHIFMPGMDASSKVPELVGKTLEETESYVDMMISGGSYVFGVDDSGENYVWLAANDLSETYRAYIEGGEMNETGKTGYYEGMAAAQGSYEKKTYNGKEYYLFAQNQSGFKVRTMIGTTEFSLRCYREDKNYSDELIEQLLSIADSITVPVSNVELFGDTLYLKDRGAGAYTITENGVYSKVLHWTDEYESYYDSDSAAWLWYNNEGSPAVWQYWFEGASSSYGDYGWMEYSNGKWYVEKSAGEWIEYPGDTSKFYYIQG